jgi:uncharacterized membrane protein
VNAEGKKMKKIVIFAWLIVLLAFVVSTAVYSMLPDEIASHWNAKGEADDTMGKFWGLFLMPFTLLGLQVLFMLIPKIDPLKKNFEKFHNYYDGFILFFLLFMFLIHLHIIVWNLGVEINPNIFMPVALGLFFIYAGILCEKAKRNWFVGMRTPWTLSSDSVWEKTNKRLGKLFKICGVIAILAAFAGDLAIYIALIPILFVSLYAFFYSYFLFKKEENTK